MMIINTVPKDQEKKSESNQLLTDHSYEVLIWLIVKFKTFSKLKILKVIEH